jgi:hypothetical protein
LVWENSNANVLGSDAFVQNKANFRKKPKMTVSSVFTMDYEQKVRLASKSKQSQTNPILMLRWASFSGLGELAEGM